MMTNAVALADLKARLDDLPRFRLAQLPTPLHRLNNFGALLDGPQLWMKRDDLSGLEGGGNKTRKLEFLVGDAIRKGCDMLVSVGAIQSNHTRQVAASAARAGMKCALLHCAWTKDAGPNYRQVGNILLSHLMGAELYFDEVERPIEDQGPLEEFIAHLNASGHSPYLIPGGASEHPLGSMGYVNCAAELASQMDETGITFSHLLHTTGSSSTQAGLLAGFSALGLNIRVIGVADDGETEIKTRRVRELANEALETLGLPHLVQAGDVEVIASNNAGYGFADDAIKQGIHLMAAKEGLIADPVYEGRAIRGLLDLNAAGRFRPDNKILLMHLGGSPAIHAYAEQFGAIEFKPFSAIAG
ncbi:MAG: 1-aminocyclopropane-1-carboxylate deaminase/D-cysteine desulfhydrase [Anderseniella sp.]